ncbi:hypothetical protein B0H63DRAFT_527255 [Podospora didyma]|uniref:Uncharacterized protein n=1 Tax=Podospora didyma TaxID=330526 RepID=A0AAE0KA28_9PEZI|nr:hypothetical protein B0H63DRAFT_527255 [Podospora didyma]
MLFIHHYACRECDYLAPHILVIAVTIVFVLEPYQRRYFNSHCLLGHMIHVTKKASGYFGDMWLWVANHMIDDPLLNDALNNMDQLSVFSARGALIESQKTT